jgi:hypothetical protein
MPPKPPEPDFDDRHDQAVALETTVNGLLHHGEAAAAENAFADNWESTTLPHIPQRYAFVVQKVNMRSAQRLMNDVLEAGDADTATFSLHPGVDPRRPEQVGVVYDDAKLLLGFLPDGAREVLDRAGEHADLYAVEYLGLDRAADGRLALQLEFVRPALRQCAGCGALHAEGETRCAKCRSTAKRKRKREDEDAGTRERGSVPLARAFREITSDAA